MLSGIPNCELCWSPILIRSGSRGAGNSSAALLGGVLLGMHAIALTVDFEYVGVAEDTRSAKICP